MATKYYSLDAIHDKGAKINVIVGERSNGKTYSVLKHALDLYKLQGSKLAIVRRWQDDLRGKRGDAYFNSLVANGEIKNATNGEWDNVVFKSNQWFFSRVNQETGKREIAAEPFAYAFALTTWEHDKGGSFPEIDIILFDEFITRGRYLPDEFVIFMNVISTIVRYRANVIVYMLANTVSKYGCPYFSEMGLMNVDSMQQGEIQVYEFGDSGLRVAVEYADSPNKTGKASDVYFAFDNPKLKMITGGVWEMAIYPHCPCKYTPKDVLFRYFIQYYGKTLQCEIVQVDDMTFTFIHYKTTPLQDTTNDLIYSPDYSPRPNYRRKITRPFSDSERLIWNFYDKEKVFYQSNEVGELVRSYIEWCRTDKIV